MAQRHSALRLAVLVAVVLLSIAALASARTARMPAHMLHQLHRVHGLHRSRDVVVEHDITRRDLSDRRAYKRVTINAFDKPLTLVVWPDEEQFGSVSVRVIDETGVPKYVPFPLNQFYTGYIEGDDKSTVFLFMHDTDMEGYAIAGDGEKYNFERAKPHYKDMALEAGEELPDLLAYRDSDINQAHNPLNNKASPFCAFDKDKHSAHADNHAHAHAHAHAHNHNDAHAHSKQPQPQSPSPSLVFQQPQQQQQRVRRAFASEAAASNRTCQLAVSADSSFYNSNGADIVSTLSVMLRHVSRANGIFSATNFTNILGVKLRVVNATVYTSSLTDPYNKTYSLTTGPDLLLTDFSANNWNGFCSSHLFVSKNMASNTLGLAYLGASGAGICAQFTGTSSKNTGWTTNTNSGSRLAGTLNELVTSHEIGHNFGSQHDLGDTCAPDGNHFLMNAIAVDGSSSNNQLFSTCSRDSIHNVILARGSLSCMPETASSTCNNGVIDDGESCDPGIMPDACCNGTCSLKANANCSALNSCCTGSCGLNSALTCFTEFIGDTQCRSTTQCGIVDDVTGFAITSAGSFQSGTGIFVSVDGHNGTVGCPNSAVKAAGTPCGQGGRCTGSTAFPRCIGFCERYGAISCTCSGSDQCAVCCKHNASVTATDSTVCFAPFKAFNSSGEYLCKRGIDVVTLAAVQNDNSCASYNVSAPSTTLFSDNPKMDPSCNSSCTRVLFQATNTPCSGGLCSVEGTCVSSSSEVTLNSVSLSAVEDWARNNIVGAVMIGAFLIWCPCGILIHRADKKERAQNINYGKRVIGGTMVRRESRRRSMNQQRFAGKQATPGRPTSPYGVSRF